MLPGKLHVCRMFSEGNSFATPKMLNGVIFISCEQILGKKITGSHGSYPVLLFALWSISYMEWQCDWNSESLGWNQLHSNSRVYGQKNENRRVGGGRGSASLLVMKLSCLFRKEKKEKKSCKWKNERNTETTWRDKNLVECDVNLKYWGACFDFPVVLAGFQVQHCKHIWSLWKQKLKSIAAQ